MPRKIYAIKFWQEMSFPALLRFSFAAFLLFSALGLVSILIESSIRVFPWQFVLIQAGAAGGMASTIVLLRRRRWWITLLVVLSWNAVFILNGGGLSFVINNGEGLRVRLGESIGAHEHPAARQEGAVLTPEQLDAVFVQRGIVGAAIIVLLVTGYTMFITVIRGEIRRRARLEAEVRIARGIQQSLLPRVPYDSALYSVYGATLPAGEVGGDYYDIIPLSEGRMALAIADVTGHGVGAGILSAMTKSALHLQLDHETSPESVLNHLNKVICEVSDEKTFVTFAYVLVIPGRSEVAIATAGHPPAMFRTEATRAVTPLRSKSMALGMRQDASFTGTLSVQYQPGDLVLLYTDGLIEVTDPSERQFGEQLPLLLAKAEGTPQEIVTGLLDELRRFAGQPAGFDDDVSLVCLRFKGGSR
jgi:serine phosphatase RsbU (regulator of sigma subunit)